MNIKKIALSAIVSATMLATGLFAQGKSENKMLQSSIHAKTINTEWTNRPYDNNEDETRQLCVDGAESIRVTITGEIEYGYDYLSISDNSGYELEKLTGELNEELIVEGDCITTHFTSDYMIAGEGYTITVEDAGDVEPDTEWINRPYENNEDETKQLCVDGAASIIVTITGEIESGYDFLTINTTSGTEITKVSGILDLGEPLIVESNCISAHFTSDGSVTKEGFTITVIDADDIIILPSDTEWINRPYENNEDETRELCIDGAEDITVLIDGEIEANYDFLSISDTSGNELAKLTGKLDEVLIVEGNCISADFTSDGSVTKEGFTITVLEGALIIDDGSGVHNGTDTERP